MDSPTPSPLDPSGADRSPGHRARAAACWLRLRHRFRGRRLGRATRTFLAAEAAGDDLAAEAALVALFAALSRSAPAAGFADRVLGAAGLDRRATSPWLRWAAVIALSLVGLSLAWLAPAAGAVLFHLEPASLLGSGVGLFTGSVAMLEMTAPLWRLALALSRAAGALISQPPVLMLLLASAAAAGVLHHLARPGLSHSGLPDDFRRSSLHG